MRHPDDVGPLLRAVREKEPLANDGAVVPVRVVRGEWTTRRLEPAVLVLDRASARLWRGGHYGEPRLQVELGPGTGVRFRGETVWLGEIALYVLGGEGDRAGDRADRHRVVAVLERALGPAPDVEPTILIERLGRVPGGRTAVGSLGVLGGCLAAVGVYFSPGFLADWTLDYRATVLAAVLLALGATWLWLPRKWGDDGWVALYPDRLVHIQDLLVAHPWSAVRGFDDRPSGWVVVDCDPPVAIPTVDEAMRTAVLAHLDASGLARRA